jgi:parallel beta-helix repeat protein
MPAPTRLLPEPLEDRWVPATLTVDADGGRQFTTISAAVAAAGKNDTVEVFAAHHGYTETVNIPAAKTGLKVVGKDCGVVLHSPAAVGADFQGGDALIDVRAAKVEIRGLILDGSTDADGRLNAGIRVIDGGSAAIRDNVITGLKTAANPQYGIGVQVGGSSLGAMKNVGTADVGDNIITDYSGAGVLVDAAGSSADVEGNLIVGRGAANGSEPQYGVQVSFGAAAEVERNVIANNSAAGSGGVLLYQAAGGKGTEVENNVAVNNDVGIWVFQSPGDRNGRPEVENNVVAGSGFAGILVDTSDNASVKNNDVSCGDGDGIDVFDSTGVEVKNNRSAFNPGDGVYLFGGSDNTVANNVANYNGGNGVSVEDSDNNLLSNNTARGNDGQPVVILSGTGNVVKGHRK